MHDYRSCHQIYLVIDEIRRFQKDVYNFQEVSRFSFSPYRMAITLAAYVFSRLTHFFLFLFFNIVR